METYLGYSGINADNAARNGEINHRDGETNHRGDKMWTSKKKQMVLRHLVSGYASDLLEDPMKNGDETQTHSFMFGYSIWKHIGY